MLCSPSAFDRIPALFLDGRDTGTESHRSDSGSFFIKVYSGASPEVSQAISATDSPLTRFQFYFPCHLFGLASIPLPLSSPDGFRFTPHMSSVPLSLGGTKAFYPIPRPHFGSERNGPFLYVSHTCTRTCTRTHTRTHTQKRSLPCCPSTPQGCGHAFSLHIKFFCLLSLAFYDP